MFFGPQGFGPAPGTIRYICCAQVRVPCPGCYAMLVLRSQGRTETGGCTQFMVGAQRVKVRTKAFYEAARDYMLHNDLRGARCPLCNSSPLSLSRAAAGSMS